MRPAGVRRARGRGRRRGRGRGRLSGVLVGAAVLAAAAAAALGAPLLPMGRAAEALEEVEASGPPVGEGGLAGGAPPRPPPPPEPRGWLGTRAPYAESLGGRPRWGENAALRPEAPEGCWERFLYLASRHGARYPTLKRMAQAAGLEELFAGALPAEPAVAAAAKRWVEAGSPYAGQGELAGALHALGEEEMWLLGQRVQVQFPELFAAGYSSSRFIVSSTSVPRASASAVAFGMGAFLPDQSSVGAGHCRLQPFATEQSPATEERLRFFELCPAYRQSKRAAEDWVLGRAAPLLAAAAERLGARLGGAAVVEGATRPEHVLALWAACQFGALESRGIPETCIFFSEADRHELGCLSDLEALATKGPSLPINTAIGLPLLEHALQAMKIAEKGAPERAWFQFAHAETLFPLASLLGVGGAWEAAEAFDGLNSLTGRGSSGKEWPDGEIPTDSADEGVCPAGPWGGWRSAEVMPFGSNVAFALYECGPEREPLARVFHNEQPLHLPGNPCEGGLDCTLGELDAFFQAAMARFNASCEIPGGAALAGLANGATEGDRAADQPWQIGREGLRGALQGGKTLGLAAGEGMGAAVGAAAQGALAGARGAASGVSSLARLMWAAVPEPYW